MKQVCAGAAFEVVLAAARRPPGNEDSLTYAGSSLGGFSGEASLPVPQGCPNEADVTVATDERAAEGGGLRHRVARVRRELQVDHRSEPIGDDSRECKVPLGRRGPSLVDHFNPDTSRPRVAHGNDYDG
jgi:hypothetical protein